MWFYELGDANKYFIRIFKTHMYNNNNQLTVENTSWNALVVEISWFKYYLFLHFVRSRANKITPVSWKSLNVVKIEKWKSAYFSSLKFLLMINIGNSVEDTIHDYLNEILPPDSEPVWWQFLLVPPFRRKGRWGYMSGRNKKLIPIVSPEVCDCMHVPVSVYVCSRHQHLEIDCNLTAAFRQQLFFSENLTRSGACNF